MHRVLATLLAEGHVEKQAPSDCYRLTSRVTLMAVGFQSKQSLLEVAKPLVAEAGKELGWPLALTMPRDGEMFIRLATDHECPRVRERFQIGFSVPIVHATAGFCHLAHAAPDEREATLTAALRAAKARHMGIEDPLEIEYLINRTRKQAFCI